MSLDALSEEILSQPIDPCYFQAYAQQPNLQEFTLIPTLASLANDKARVIDIFHRVISKLQEEVTHYTRETVGEKDPSWDGYSALFELSLEPSKLNELAAFAKGTKEARDALSAFIQEKIIARLEAGYNEETGNSIDETFVREVNAEFPDIPDDLPPAAEKVDAFQKSSPTEESSILTLFIHSASRCWSCCNEIFERILSWLIRLVS